MRQSTLRPLSLTGALLVAAPWTSFDAKAQNVSNAGPTAVVPRVVQTPPAVSVAPTYAPQVRVAAPRTTTVRRARVMRQSHAPYWPARRGLPPYRPWLNRD